MAFLGEVVAYFHAAFSYREGNIPSIECIITLKQGPEICTAFLQKSASCLPYILELSSIEVAVLSEKGNVSLK